MQKKHYEPGYLAFNGYIFTQSDCDLYNSIQDRIFAFKKAGISVPESIKKDSFKTFKLIIGVL